MAEVASAYVTLIPSTKGFGKRTSAELGGPLEKSGKEGGRRFGSGMSGGIASLGTKIFAPLAAAAATVSIGSFFKDAVAGASDLNESSTKIQAIFGKASGSVQDFAKQGAKALGQTQLQVLDAAASFGTFGKAAGLQGPELAKFSTGLAGLSTDLSSFFNTSPEEAAQAIAAGLRGESEPLRQYGVLLDDATLRQEALKQGLIKTTKQALTPQQKVLAAQAVIYKQTKDAQGDFARTSGGLANQQRILSAQFSDFRTSVGKALLPVVLKVVTGLNNMGPALKRVGQFLAPIKEGFVVFFEALRGGEVTTLGTLGRIGDAAYSLRDAFFSVLPKVKALFATVVGVILTNVVPAAKALAGYVITNVVPILQQLGTIVVTKIVPAFLAVAGFIYGRLYPALIAIVSAVAARLKPVLDQLFATIQARIIPIIQLIAAKFQEWWPTIQKVVTFIVTLVGWVLKLAASILGKVLPVVIKFAGFLITVVVKAIIAVIEFVAKVVGALIKFGTGVVDVVKKFLEFESGVRDVLGRVVRFFFDLPGNIVKAIGNVDELLLSAGRKIIDGLLRGITEGFQKVKDKLGELTNKLPDWKGPRSKDKTILRDAGRLVISGFVGGMESQYSDVRGSLQGLTRGLAAGAPALAAGAAVGASPGAMRLHPHDIALLADAMASRPTVLDGRRVSQSMDRTLAMGVHP